jgi:hypothetical protein
VRQDDSEPEGGIGMGSVERSIEVRVPVSTAYNQWTQFESFPRFMEGVDRVDQISPTTTHWVTGLVGHRIEGDLKRFKAFIESRGAEEGGWRGTVDRPATP